MSTQKEQIRLELRNMGTVFNKILAVDGTKVYLQIGDKILKEELKCHYNFELFVAEKNIIFKHKGKSYDVIHYTENEGNYFLIFWDNNCVSKKTLEIKNVDFDYTKINLKVIEKL